MDMRDRQMPRDAPGVMPWGKHGGARIDTLPLHYLRWCLEQDWLKPALREALDAELTRRFPDPGPPIDVDDIEFEID